MRCPPFHCSLVNTIYKAVTQGLVPGSGTLHFVSVSASYMISDGNISVFISATAWFLSQVSCKKSLRVEWAYLSLALAAVRSLLRIKLASLSRSYIFGSYLLWLPAEDGIFMHNNALTHTAYVVRDALAEMEIEVMIWPPHSPDINQLRTFGRV